MVIVGPYLTYHDHLVQKGVLKQFYTYTTFVWLLRWKSWNKIIILLKLYILYSIFLHGHLSDICRSEIYHYAKYNYVVVFLVRGFFSSSYISFAVFKSLIGVIFMKRGRNEFFSSSVILFFWLLWMGSGLFFSLERSNNLFPRGNSLQHKYGRKLGKTTKKEEKNFPMKWNWFFSYFSGLNIFSSSKKS